MSKLFNSQLWMEDLPDYLSPLVIAEHVSENLSIT